MLGGHYIHRKRQFRLEQALAIEENPYLYKSKPGKERDLMIPMAIIQLEAIETISAIWITKCFFYWIGQPF